MKLGYYQDVDVLYIRLSDSPVTDTREIAALALGDFDAEEWLVSVTLSEASHPIDIEALPHNLLEHVESEAVSVETATGCLKWAG